MNNSKVIAGHLRQVTNANRRHFSNSCTWYWSLWVEDANGRNERCLLLTDHEYLIGQNRASHNLDDCVHTGDDSAIQLDSGRDRLGRIKRVYNKYRIHWKATPMYFAIPVTRGAAEECLLYTKKELDRMETRASSNLEDVPKKSFLTDLFD